MSHARTIGFTGLALAGLFLATPAHAAPCLSFDDPKGDSGATTQGVTIPGSGEPTMDIVKVAYKGTKDSLVLEMTVDKLTAPSRAWGDYTAFDFTVGGKVVRVYEQRTPTRDVEGNVFIQKSVTVDGSDKGDDFTAAYDEGKNVITFTVKYSVMKAALGSAIEAAKLTDVGGRRRGSYIALLSTFDTATTDKTFAVAACK